MPLVLEEMSERLASPLAVEQSKVVITKQLAYLHDANPVIFRSIQDRVSSYPASSPISKEDLQEINTNLSKQVLIATNIKIAGGVSGTLSALATITDSAELQKVSNLSVMLIDFTKNANILNELINQKPKVDFASCVELFASSFSVVTIGLKLFGAFMEASGPSFEEVMLEQLQAISKQIQELHKDMLREFGEVHDHLRLLHDSLYECTTDIKLLIENKINGFRENATHRLNEIQSNIVDLKDDVRSGQIQSLLQKLKGKCVDVERHMQEVAVASEDASIKELADHLEGKWIKLHAADPVLSASSYNASTHKLDTYFLKQNKDQLHNILGYIAKIGKANGLNLDDVDVNKIVNVDVSKMAIASYLKLRRKFYAYIADDANGSKLSEIISYLENTLRLVKNIQRSHAMFNNAFVNYVAAVNEVQNAIDVQNDAASAHYRELYNCQLIDLNHDAEQMKVAFKLQRPKDSFATPSHDSSSPLPRLDLRSYRGYDNFDFPRELVIAELLGIDGLSIKTSYGGFWRLEVRSRAGVHSAAIHDVRVDFAGNPNTFAINEAQDTEKPYVPNENRYYIKFFVKFSFANTFHWNGYEVYLDKNTGASSEAVKNLLANPSNIGRILLANSELLSCIVSSPIKVNVWANESEHDKRVLYSLPDKINAWILNARKAHVPDALLKNNSSSFTQSLDHLDSAKQRLVTFGTVAGLPEEMQLQIMALKSSENVMQDLRNYKLYATMADKYWQKPDLNSINVLKNACIALIGNPNTIFRSKVEQSILETIAPVNVYRALYIRYTANPELIEKSITDKARSLGIHPATLAGSPFIGGVPQYCTLITAIIEGDCANIKRACVKDNGKTTGVDITKTLNERLVCAIHLAAYIGNAAVISEIFKYDIDKDCINETLSNGDTPMMYAVQSRSLDAVRLLYDLGADITKVNNAGKSAVQIARDLGLGEIVILLNIPRVVTVIRPRIG